MSPQIHANGRQDEGIAVLGTDVLFVHRPVVHLCHIYLVTKERRKKTPHI